MNLSILYRYLTPINTTAEGNCVTGGEIFIPPAGTAHDCDARFSKTACIPKRNGAS